jgi:hypothetical protein
MASVLGSMQELVMGSVVGAEGGNLVGAGEGGSPLFARAALLSIYLLAIARINLASLFAIDRNLLARAIIVFHTHIIVIIISSRSKRPA